MERLKSGPRPVKLRSKARAQSKFRHQFSSPNWNLLDLLEANFEEVLKLS